MHRIETGNTTDPTTAWWRCWLDRVTSVQVDASTVRLTLPANQRSNPTRIATAATTALQAFLDVRTPRASLPPSALEATVDPALPWYFWNGTDLVTRHHRVTVSWVLAGTNDNAVDTYALSVERLP